MISNPLLLDSEQTSLFLRLVTSCSNLTDRNEISQAGMSALALALAYGVPDVNAEVEISSSKHPLLNWTIKAALSHHYSNYMDGVHQSKLLRLSQNPSESLPPYIEKLSGHERLAIWLIQQGADPWQKGDDGKDALDWAVVAQSRTLVDFLLKHPNCPSIESLMTRTTTQAGRELPWLHTLAYFNGVDLFDDLLSAGFDSHQVDKNGWMPLGWVNNIAALKNMLDLTDPAPSAEELVNVSAAWSRRATQKLTTYRFSQVELKKLLDAMTTLSDEDQHEVKLSGIVERLWSANPTNQEYNYKGFKWEKYKGVNVETHESMIQLLKENFDWRKTQKSGSSKGTWSLLGASVWGTSRGQKEEGSQLFVKAFHEVLSAQTPQVQQAWLDESIRPGLTNRGLATWALGGLMTPEERAILTPGAETPAAEIRLRAEQALQAVSAMWSKNAAQQTASLLQHRMSKLIESDRIFSVPYGQSLELWKISLVRDLTDMNLLEVSLNSYDTITSSLISGLTSPDNTELNIVVPATLSVLSLSAHRISEVSNNFYSTNRGPVESKFHQKRKGFYENIISLLNQTPQMSSYLLEAQYPFGRLSDAEKEFLPDETVWGSMIRMIKLSAVAQNSASTVTETSQRRKPSM